MLPGKIVTKTRGKDVKNDKMFTGFLQKQVYPEMMMHGILDAVSIVPEDEFDQFKGIDAYWVVDGKVIPVDHKTRTSMTNKKCGSLSLEVKTTDLTEPDQPEYRGWIINDKLKSEYYLFAHITSAGDGTCGIKGVTPDNINEVKFNLCKKSEVRAFIEKNICSSDELYDYALQCEQDFFRVNAERKAKGLYPINVRFTDGPFEKYKKTFIGNNGDPVTYNQIYLVTSTLDERPTNLVIPEWIINKMPSSRNFFWSRKDGIIESSAR